MLGILNQLGLIRRFIGWQCDLGLVIINEYNISFRLNTCMEIKITHNSTAREKSGGCDD